VDSFSLAFELDGAGWARAKVVVNGVAHETSVSYLTSDPLGSFASALIAVAWPEEETVFVIEGAAPAPTDEELRTREFTWQDEPGGWRWLLTPGGNGLAKLRIQELGGRDLPAVTLVDASCALDQLARACAACIERLAVLHGLVGYRLKWHYGDLPLSQLLLLRRWLSAPNVNPTSGEGGTWADDMSVLRQLDA
jgi:hypothetical protein